MVTFDSYSELCVMLLPKSQDGLYYIQIYMFGITHFGEYRAVDKCK